MNLGFVFVHAFADILWFNFYNVSSIMHVNMHIVFSLLLFMEYIFSTLTGCRIQYQSYRLIAINDSCVLFHFELCPLKFVTILQCTFYNVQCTMYLHCTCIA